MNFTYHCTLNVFLPKLFLGWYFLSIFRNNVLPLPLKLAFLLEIWKFSFLISLMSMHDQKVQRAKQHFSRLVLLVQTAGKLQFYMFYKVRASNREGE